MVKTGHATSHDASEDNRPRLTCGRIAWRALFIEPYPSRRGRQRHVRVEGGFELPVGELLAVMVGVGGVVGVGEVAGVAWVVGVVHVVWVAWVVVVVRVIVMGDAVEAVEVVEVVGVVEVGVKRRQPGKRLRLPESCTPSKKINKLAPRC